MLFVIGRGFAEFQILIKLKLALSLEPFVICISIKFRIHIYIYKLQAMVLPNFIFHIIWSRVCRGKNSKRNKGNWPYLLNRANILIKFCIHIDIDKI